MNPTLRQRLRLVPKLTGIKSVTVDAGGSVCVVGDVVVGDGDTLAPELAGRELVYRVFRLPRTLRLMVVVSIEGWGGMWEYQAQELPDYLQRVRLPKEARNA